MEAFDTEWDAEEKERKENWTEWDVIQNGLESWKII